MTKAAQGRKGLSSLHLHHCSSSQDRSLEVGTYTEAMKGCCLWLAQPTFVKNPGPPALPHQFPIKKMPHRLPYSPILWRHFLNWISLLSDDFRLRQVDIKLASAGAESQLAFYLLCFLLILGSHFSSCPCLRTSGLVEPSLICLAKGFWQTCLWSEQWEKALAVLMEEFASVSRKAYAVLGHS